MASNLLVATASKQMLRLPQLFLCLDPQASGNCSFPAVHYRIVYDLKLKLLVFFSSACFGNSFLILLRHVRLSQFFFRLACVCVLSLLLFSCLFLCSSVRCFFGSFFISSARVVLLRFRLLPLRCSSVCFFFAHQSTHNSNAKVTRLPPPPRVL